MTDSEFNEAFERFYLAWNHTITSKKMSIKEDYIKDELIELYYSSECKRSLIHDGKDAVKHELYGLYRLSSTKLWKELHG